MPSPRRLATAVESSRDLASFRKRYLSQVEPEHIGACVRCQNRELKRFEFLNFGEREPPRDAVRHASPLNLLTIGRGRAQNGSPFLDGFRVNRPFTLLIPANGRSDSDDIGCRDQRIRQIFEPQPTRDG